MSFSVFESKFELFTVTATLPFTVQLAAVNEVRVRRGTNITFAVVYDK